MSFLSDYYPDVNKDELKVLERLWKYGKEIEPRATEGLSYGLPALKFSGRPLLGLAITKTHMSIYPFSNKIIEELELALSDFDLGKGVIRFGPNNAPTKKHLELISFIRFDIF